MENREMNLEDLEKAAGGETPESRAVRLSQMADVRRRLTNRKNNFSDLIDPVLSLRMELDRNSKTRNTVLTTEDIVRIWCQVYEMEAPAL